MTREISVDELFNEDFKPAWLVQEETGSRTSLGAFLIFVFALRYGTVETCFKCGKPKQFYLLSNRRCFACAWCSKQIHPLAGTSLQKTQTPLWKWLEVANELKQHDMPAMEIKRRYGMTYKCAWRIKKVILKDFATHDILYAFVCGGRVNDALLTHYQFRFVNKRSTLYGRRAS